MQNYYGLLSLVLFIILDHLQVGHSLLFDMNGTKYFGRNVSYHAINHYAIICPNMIFFLSFNSSCLDNAMKLKNVSFLKCEKGLLYSITILTLILKLRKAFGLGILLHEVLHISIICSL